MIEVRRVDFLAVPVADLGRAGEFYGSTLGLERSPTSGERWVEHETQNLTIALSTFGGALALGVPDVDEAKRTLEQAGVEFHGETFDSGVCNGAPFSDADGNHLLLHRRYAPLPEREVTANEVERTDFVGIPTTDLERAERFYEGVLGLRRSPNHTPGWPEFETENVTLSLTDAAKTGDEFRPSDFRVALRVRDVADSMERLGAAGVTFAFDQVYDSSVCHMAFFKDPDGNAIMLHRRYAPYRDGSLP